MGQLTSSFIFWVVVFLIFILLETITVRLIAIWFAVGALGACVTLLLDAPFWIQVIVFLLCSCLLLLLTRPLTKSFTSQKHRITDTGSIIGQTGVVTAPIGSKAKGRVEIDGLDWAARSWDGTALTPGEKVTVYSVHGFEVVVAKAVKQS